MAIARMTATQDNAIGATSEGPQDKQRIDPAGAGNLNYFNIGRIIFASCASTIGPGIAAPITSKGHDFRFIGVVF